MPAGSRRAFYAQSMGRGKRLESGNLAGKPRLAPGRTLQQSFGWEELDAHLPWLTGTELHVVTVPIYQSSAGDWAVEGKLPGIHQDQTYLPGGDFVVVVYSKQAGWENGKKVQHQQVFEDVEQKCQTPEHRSFMQAHFLPAFYWAIGFGKAHPPVSLQLKSSLALPGMEIDALLASCQALALAEHRRFRQHEAKGGGRQLPAQLIAGIIEGKWNALECGLARTQGLRHLNFLHKTRGKPLPIAIVLSRGEEARGQS